MSEQNPFSQNEPSGQVQTAAATSFDEIGRVATEFAASTAAAKHGVSEKTARAQKAANARWSKARGDAQSPAAAAPAPAVDKASPKVDRALVEKTVSALVKVIDGAVTRAIYARSLHVSNDKDFARNVASETALTDDERKIICELSGVLAEKYSLASRYAPEIALCIVLTGYGARSWWALRKLAEMENEKRREALATKGKTNNDEKN